MSLDLHTLAYCNVWGEYIIKLELKIAPKLICRRSGAKTR